MLMVLGIVLVVLWLLGLIFFKSIGLIIHVLLVLAVISFALKLFRRST